MEKKSIKISFLILFWFVMAIGMGGLIWLVRILFFLYNDGIYMASEPNPIILTSEIIFFIFGISFSVYVFYRISKTLLRGIIYE